MKGLILILAVLGAFVFSCQELPKEYMGEEGKKKLQRYKNQFVKGTIYVDKSLKDKLPKEDFFLIISVRDLKNPAPVAVVRVKNPEFPFKFKVTGKDKISPERFIEGELVVRARISKSPMAETQKGDLIGSTNAKAGDRNVKLVINTEVE